MYNTINWRDTTHFDSEDDYVHPDDQTQPTFEMTPGLKPFTIKLLLLLGVIVPPDSWMVELSEGLDPQIGYHFCSCWHWRRNSIPTTCFYPSLRGRRKKGREMGREKSRLPLPRLGWCFWLVRPQGKFASTNQKHYSDLGRDTSSAGDQCGFLRSFLIRHLARKPVVTSRNVGCFLGLG